jgi:hypothetical protein
LESLSFFLFFFQQVTGPGEAFCVGVPKPTEAEMASYGGGRSVLLNLVTQRSIFLLAGKDASGAAAAPQTGAMAQYAAYAAAMAMQQQQVYFLIF